MANVLSFSKVGQRSWSRSHVQNLWFRRKGLVIRYTHAKYESLISYNEKDMTNIKVFQKKVKGDGQGHKFKIYGTVGKILS